MNKKILRTSTNLSELYSSLQGVIYKKPNFTLWQNQSNVKVLVQAELINQFLSQTQLTLEFKFTTSQGQLMSKEELFLMCSELDLLLKGEIRYINNHTLKITLKKKHYAKEKRISPRIDIETKNLHARLYRQLSQKESTKREQVKVKDISDHGCGFYITSSRAVLFQPDSILLFDSLEGVCFDRQIMGRIMHVTPVEGDNSLSNKMLLVGVKFDEVYTGIDTIVQSVELNQFIS